MQPTWGGSFCRNSIYFLKEINELREKHEIPIELEEVEYEFILPEATGKTGKFIKLKKEEPQKEL